MAIIGGQDHVSSRTLIQLLSKHLKIEAISYILRRQEVNLHTLIKALTLVPPICRNLHLLKELCVM